MKKTVKTLTFVFITILIVGLLAGCGQQSPSNNSSGISGTITAAGSTALQPLAQEAAQAFQQQSPNVTINVQGGGSGTGLTQVAQGAVQIGDSDIFADEKAGIDASALVDHKVAVIGFAAVTNNDVKVDNLTKAQLIAIFTGKTTNWKDVGGPDLKITVINRPTSSGTRATFKKYALDGQNEVEGVALTEDSSGSVQKAIQATSGSIGYLALSYLTADVRSSINVLKLDGVEANTANITTGKYPVWSYEHMYTKGEATGLTKAFLDFMSSDTVKPIITKLGYIPTSDMKVQR